MSTLNMALLPMNIDGISYGDLEPRLRQEP